jgi:hypothetical protein
MFKSPQERDAFFEHLKSQTGVSPLGTANNIGMSSHMQQGMPSLPSVPSINKAHLPNVPGQVSSALNMEQPKKFNNLNKYLKGV